MLRFQRFFLGSFVILGLGVRPAMAQASTLTLDQALASAEGVNLTVLLSREVAAQAVEVGVALAVDVAGPHLDPVIAELGETGDDVLDRLLAEGDRAEADRRAAHGGQIPCFGGSFLSDGSHEKSYFGIQLRRWQV